MSKRAEDYDEHGNKKPTGFEQEVERTRSERHKENLDKCEKHGCDWDENPDGLGASCSRCGRVWTH